MNIESTNDPKILSLCKNFLEAHKKMVISVLDQNGHPDSSLVLYVIDDEFNFYFGTRKAFGKYKAIHANPYVAAAVVQEDIDPLQVVDMKGVCTELAAHESQEVLDWFTSKNQSEYYVKDAEDFVLVKVTPYRLRWLDATSGELEIYDIHTIDQNL